jgi:hypothetical protein
LQWGDDFEQSRRGQIVPQWASQFGTHYDDPSRDQFIAIDIHYDRQSNRDHLSAVPIVDEQRNLRLPLQRAPPQRAPPGLVEPILVTQRGVDTSNLDSSGILQERLVQYRDHVSADQRRKQSRDGDYITDSPVIPIHNENAAYFLPTPFFAAGSPPTHYITTLENFGFVGPRARPHVMTMVANMEQGRPQPRHFDGNDMSIAEDEISDEFQVPRDAQRNQVFRREDSVRGDASDISGRSRTRSLNERKVEKNILLKSLQTKRMQRKCEEEKIELEIMKIDARVGIGGARAGTSSRSNRSSSSASSSALSILSTAISETTRRRRRREQ